MHSFDPPDRRFIVAIALFSAACISPPGQMPSKDASPDDAGSDMVRIDEGTMFPEDAATSDADSSDLGGREDFGSDLGSDLGRRQDMGAPGCQVTLPFNPRFAFSQTLWVDDDAASGGDGSENAPYQTLQAAASAATPGTQIVLRPGNYSGSSFITGFDDGTSEAPYGIIGEEGAVIGGVNGTAIQLKSPKWVLLENLTIENVANGHGLNIDNSNNPGSAHHVVLRDIKVANVSPTPSRCVRLTGVNDFVVIDSSFSQCAHNAIQVTGGVRGTVANSRFFNTVDRGLSLESGVEDVLVHGNHFENVGDRNVHVGGGGSLPANATYSAANVRVVANVFSNNLSGDAPITDADCLDCLYANNAFLGTPGTILRILRENNASQAGSGGRFVNNLIVVSSAPSPFIQVGVGTQPGTYTIDYNAWWVMDDATFGGPDLSEFIHDGNDVYGDPMLAQQAGELLPGSPLAAAGLEGVVEGVPDAFGNCFSTTPTIGAHEVSPEP